MSYLRILIATLLFASGPVLADWTEVAVSATDGSMVYVDTSTIRREGTTRKVWSLWDYKKVEKTGELSVRTRMEVDCVGERLRVTSGTSHKGQMATGVILTNFTNNMEPWTDIPPGTVNSEILRVVCKS